MDACKVRRNMICYANAWWFPYPACFDKTKHCVNKTYFLFLDNLECLPKCLCVTGK